MTTPPTNGNGQLLDQAAFTEYVEQQLHTLDGIEVVAVDGMTLTLQVRGTDLRLDLGDFYTSYTNKPDQLDAVVQTLVKTLQGFNPDRSTSNFDELRDNIFPMLKPLTLLETVTKRHVPMLVYRPFLANLIITYVVDEAQSVAYINEEHLEHWGLSEHVLYEQALQNLRLRTLNNTQFTTVGTDAQRLFIFSSQDGYDATRILLSDILQEWQQQLPGTMVIGIPNRDFLIAFSDSDRTVLTNVALQIQADTAQQAYGLTDRLFMLTNNEIREYDWE